MWWWHFWLCVCVCVWFGGLNRLWDVVVTRSSSWFIWVECENNGYSRLFPPRNSRIGVEGRPRLGMCGLSWLFVKAV